MEKDYVVNGDFLVFNNAIAYDLSKSLSYANIQTFVGSGRNYVEENGVASLGDFPYLMDDKKNRFIKFNKDTNVLPRNAIKIYHAAMDNVRFGDNIDIFKKYAYSGIHVKCNNYKLNEMIRTRIDVIKSFQSDNIEHIAPIGIIFNTSDTKQLKKLIGTANWKSLCANSFSRNLKIMKVWFAASRMTEEAAVKMVNFMNGIPSKFLDATILDTAGDCWERYDERSLKLLQEACKSLPTTEKHQLRSVRSMVDDTIRMINRVKDNGYRIDEYSERWSYDKVHQMHDYANQILNRINELNRGREPVAADADAEFDLSQHPLKEIVIGDITAHLLTSYQALKDESSTMNHCIGNSDYYAKRISSQSYIAFSLRDEKGTVSTLGIKRASVLRPDFDIMSNAQPVDSDYRYHWSLDQHSGVRNGAPRRDVSSHAQNIISRLNALEAQNGVELKVSEEETEMV